MNPRTTHGLQAQSPFVPLVPQSRTPQAGRDPVQGYGYYSAQHYEDPDPHPDVSISSVLAISLLTALWCSSTRRRNVLKREHPLPQDLWGTPSCPRLRPIRRLFPTSSPGGLR
jgi:hypothetical protein